QIEMSAFVSTWCVRLPLVFPPPESIREDCCWSCGKVGILRLLRDSQAQRLFHSFLAPAPGGETSPPGAARSTHSTIRPDVGTPAPGIPPASRASACARSAKRRSEEHTSELQSRRDLVCRLLLE